MTQQQEAQAKQAAEAQADALAALAQADKEAATILKDAQAKAARMVQQQENQAKQAADATKQQVIFSNISLAFMVSLPEKFLTICAEAAEPYLC